MPSYQTSLTQPKKVAGRFIAAVRRELQKALAEEHAAHGVTQASIAATLGVNRSVIHRQIVGFENLTLGRVGEIAGILGREVIFALVNPAQDGNHRISFGPAIDNAPQSPSSLSVDADADPTTQRVIIVPPHPLVRSSYSY
jgi:hypothetical protein